MMDEQAIEETRRILRALQQEEEARWLAAKLKGHAPRPSADVVDLEAYRQQRRPDDGPEAA